MLSSCAKSTEVLCFCILGGDDEGRTGDFDLRFDILREGILRGSLMGVDNAAGEAAKASPSVSHDLVLIFNYYPRLKATHKKPMVPCRLILTNSQ